MNPKQEPYRYWSKQVIFFAALLICLGCWNVHWISDYDQVTDESLTALQQKTDDFIVSLEQNYGTDAASYVNSQSFYEDIDKDLRGLEFRVGSIPDNGRTVELVKNIRLVILGEGLGEEGASLQDLHRLPVNAEKGIKKTPLEIARRNISQTISAALALELAKKQGSEKNK